jgi:hypothetical protein
VMLSDGRLADDAAHRAKLEAGAGHLPSLSWIA